MKQVNIVGGGLAGSEAAWQVASRGVPVVLHEMRPVRPTLVHKTDHLAELVCSNSFRGDSLENAVGLLKEEMRRLGSIVMRGADAARVPAGGALAVDRVLFSGVVTEAVSSHPLITLTRGELDHVLTVLKDNEREGWYFGNREQYWQRHQRIVQKIEAAMTAARAQQETE